MTTKGDSIHQTYFSYSAKGNFKLEMITQFHSKRKCSLWKNNSKKCYIPYPFVVILLL